MWDVLVAGKQFLLEVLIQALFASTVTLCTKLRTLWDFFMSTVELTVMILLKFYGTTLKAVSREKVYAYTIKKACTSFLM